MKLTKERIEEARRGYIDYRTALLASLVCDMADAMLEAEASKFYPPTRCLVCGKDIAGEWQAVGMHTCAGKPAPERCGGTVGKPNWRAPSDGAWHTTNVLCKLSPFCVPCPGCPDCAPKAD